VVRPAVQRIVSRTSVVVALGAAALALPAAPATVAAPAHQSSFCPGAESLVPGTTFHHHRVAPGVTLAEGTAHDSRGVVGIHVLRVAVANRKLRFTPLFHSLAELSPLTRLAARHRHLVAAVNTGFYDMFGTGAPYGPLIVDGRPVVMSTTGATVVGFTEQRRVADAQVWLRGTVRAGPDHHSLAAINEVRPPSGLSVYTRAWGSEPIPAPRGAAVRVAQAGRIRSVRSASRQVPRHGELFVAQGASARAWLSALPAGTPTRVVTQVESNQAVPLVQAYGVGSEWVGQAGVVQHGFTCRVHPTSQPARTAIGYDDGGRQLVIVVVADHPGTSSHGLDADQMSGLLVQLGVSRGYAWDGSGSSELLARMSGTGLSLRNYPADGRERPMPLGFGIETS